MKKMSNFEMIKKVMDIIDCHIYEGWRYVEKGAIGATAEDVRYNYVIKSQLANLYNKAVRLGINEPENGKIIITIKDGEVASVSSDMPRVIHDNVVVLNYDIAGVDEDDLTYVVDEAGAKSASASAVVVSHMTVNKTLIDMEQFKK